MKVLIFLGQNVNINQYDLGNSYLIGVDKGASILASNFIKMDLAIGDFDSSGQKIEQVAALKRIIDYLLGENREAFLEHIAKQNDGFRPLDVMQGEILEIINASEQVKNS